MRPSCVTHTRSGWAYKPGIRSLAGSKEGVTFRKRKKSYVYLVGILRAFKVHEHLGAIRAVKLPRTALMPLRDQIAGNPSAANSRLL